MTMITSDLGQSCIEIEFFWVLIYNIMLLMDESLLTIVASTVKVELIGKKSSDVKLYCINYIIVIVFCLAMMQLQWMEFELEQVV